MFVTLTFNSKIYNDIRKLQRILPHRELCIVFVFVKILAILWRSKESTRCNDCFPFKALLILGVRFYSNILALIYVLSSSELKARELFWSPVFCLSVRLSGRLSGRPSVCKHFTFSSSQEPLGPISTKLGTKHPWVKGIQFLFK